MVKRQMQIIGHCAIIFGGWKDDIGNKVLASKQENLNLIPEPVLDKIQVRRANGEGLENEWDCGA
ncbi:hypothetical protein I79_003108 [Cricetulus griseus]|uniref:Uncharacterized protein n=1 Tax=Cricetulus griseus TaxID=10029 RepID=G3GZ77_CRIGR|nr:hypothetical protein I79_003108 [Cricetulus griseus]